MKSRIFLFFTTFFLVFISCEKEALEPELREAHLEMETKANKARQVLSFRAHLSGDEEVPAVDTDATGQTIFKLSKDGTELHYKLIVANIENVTMAHIHKAPAGANGGVVAWLFPEGPPPTLVPGRTDGILAEGVITESSLTGALAGASLQDLLDLIMAGETYVNVHTSQFPGGEIRGQIKPNNGK